MRAFLHKYHRLLFYGTWTLLNLVQALFTELQDDEAYYWVFARYLDWGYFDHPPMTAAFIKLGTFFLSGEIAVRFFFVLLQTGTLLLAENLTRRKHPFLFYAIAASLAVLQLTGFWAVPDAPLLFFTALLFWLYDRYLQRSTWTNALLIGLVTACLLYSKYHGVLILLFILLSNLRLFRDPKIYAAGLFGLLLFTPHLIWQAQHDWISFRYHLFESNVNPYKPAFTLDYIAGQLLLAGPLAGFILLPALFRYRPQDGLERSLKFTGIGILAFFLLSSFKGRVEANWTAPVLLPILVLGHQYLQQRAGARRWLVRLMVPTIVLALAARIIMMVDLLPVRAVVQRFHAWNGWAQRIDRETGGLPAVFNNNYQRASKYWFYTGRPTLSLNSYDDRRNNYNFWPVEDSLLGRPVVLLDIYNTDSFPRRIQTPNWTVGYGVDSAFHSYLKAQVQTSEEAYVIRENEPLRLTLTLTLPDHYRTYLQQHPDEDQPLVLGLYSRQKWLQDTPLLLTLRQLMYGSLTVRVYPGLPKGDYFLRFGIGSDKGTFTHASEKIPLKIE